MKNTKLKIDLKRLMETIKELSDEDKIKLFYIGEGIKLAKSNTAFNIKS